MDKYKSATLNLEIKLFDNATIKKCQDVLSSGDGNAEMAEIISRLLYKWARGQIVIDDDYDSDFNKQIGDLTSSITALANIQVINQDLHKSSRNVDGMIIKLLKALGSEVVGLKQEINSSQEMIKKMSEDFQTFETNQINTNVDLNEIKQVISDELKNISVNVPSQMSSSLPFPEVSATFEDDNKYTEIVEKDKDNTLSETDISNDDIDSILSMLG